MTLLDVRNLVYGYDGPNGFAPIVENVDLSLAKGETLGVIGESGSGKSSLLYAIMRLFRRNARIASGSVSFNGRDLTLLSNAELGDLRWSGIAMVFQGAMNALNPVIRIDSLLIEAFLRHFPNATRSEARLRAEEALDLVQTPRRVASAYAHELSGGMRQRVVIALSLVCRPEILLADEPTTALDVVLQDEIMARLEELRARLEFAMILVSHDLALVAETSERLMVMYAGEIIERGPTRDVLERPMHPYTVGLLRSYPSLDDISATPISIPGSPPAPGFAWKGCRFAARCPLAEPACSEAPPPLWSPHDALGARASRCRRAEETLDRGSAIYDSVVRASS